jgi:vancomycin resistance protein YoaR
MVVQMAGKRGRKRGKKTVIVLVMAAAAASVGVTVHSMHVKKMLEAINVTTFYNGISVNGIQLGGLTPEQATSKLGTDVNDALKTKIISIVDSDKKWTITYGDFDSKYNIDDTLLAAYNYARYGTTKDRYKMVMDLKSKGKDFEAQYTYDKSKIEDELKQINSEITVDAVDSQMTRKNGKFVITDDQKGYKMDIDATLSKITALADAQQEGTVEVVGETIEPKITKAENEKATSLIGSYHTTFTSGYEGRNTNLKVGCEKINGTELAPNEEFSMNKALGPQDYEHGFKDAAVIVNGKVEDGIAGGVCQITSTLYNAVILAELNVVQRSNHSIPVSYVPLGQDAAIAGDYKDLKFRNSTDYPIYIEAYVSGNRLVTNIYGDETHDSSRKIEFENEITETIPKPAEKVTEDSNLPEGTKEVTHVGKIGKKVNTYKIVYENGKKVSRELFSKSSYSATADEVTLGTGKTDSDSKNAEATKKVESTKNNDSGEDSENSQTKGSIFGH